MNIQTRIVFNCIFILKIYIPQKNLRQNLEYHIFVCPLKYFRTETKSAFSCTSVSASDNVKYENLYIIKSVNEFEISHFCMPIKALQS